MDQIRIFFSLIKLAGLSETNWQSRVHIIEKLSKLYEEEINQSGGIYGKPVKIISKIYQGSEGEVTEKLINHLNQENDYSVVIESGGQKRYDQIVKKVDVKNFLFFSTNSAVCPENDHMPYFFQCSGVTRESKIDSAKYFLKNDFKGKSIHFLHEGKRYKNDLLPLLKTLKKPLLEHNVSLESIGEVSNLTPFIKKIIDKDLLILDVTPLKLIHVINYLNDNHKSPTVLKLYGLIDGRVNKYDFPIIEVAGERSLNSLSFQALCDRISENLTGDDKAFISSGIFRFEIPLLLAYASRRGNNKINNKNDFISAVREDVNKIDGINDIFIGKAKTYSFQNNINTNKISFNYLMPKSLQRDGEVTRIYYPTQFFPKKNKMVKTDVNYAYVDIIRITKIDIGESIWSCEFYLDINSIHSNALDIITFNNLSLINSKFETKLVKQTKDKQFGGTNYRYYIVANFDFLAIADNYPFDMQHVYIAMSISDPDKYGILQPIPEALKDEEFQLDGWKLIDAKTGILKRKEVHHRNANLEQVIEVREEVRAGWTIARTNVVTALKVGIPLIFLIFLNYYTLFIPFKSLLASIGILTTTFLSAIALYFSTEKPQPLRITTIDLIFIYYYAQAGITVLITGISGFISETIFNDSMVIMKFLMPISILIALVFLYKRIKSVRLRPRIDV